MARTEVDEIVLVGGSTRVPKVCTPLNTQSEGRTCTHTYSNLTLSQVKASLRALFGGKELNDHIDPGKARNHATLPLHTSSLWHSTNPLLLMCSLCECARICMRVDVTVAYGAASVMDWGTPPLAYTAHSYSNDARRPAAAVRSGWLRSDISCFGHRSIINKCNHSVGYLIDSIIWFITSRLLYLITCIYIL